MTWTTRLIVACGGLAAAVTAATGTAGAQPDVEAVVNSTCTYPQVMAALTDQDPKSAADPVVTGWVQQLIASPPDGRRVMVAQVQGLPTLQPYLGLIIQITHTCNNY
jgi:hemophore-related protein